MYEDASRIFTAPANLGNELFPPRISLRPIKVFTHLVKFNPLRTRCGPGISGDRRCERTRKRTTS
ncbi:hypothetical protein [Methanoculleus sp.]|uniref:hypothetical protein n=1 Tax=Methanoculleus sp. TaxID=90427 RepID=UPI0025D90E01|nr:hypothetical protein [Methanoculleus sp.]